MSDMGGCGHSEAEHKAMRDDDDAWNALRFDFFQPRASAGGSDYECRDCGHGSTLYRACVLTDDERVVVRAINAERAAKFSRDLKARLDELGIQMPSGMVA